jgi:hypothetical protein
VVYLVRAIARPRKQVWLSDRQVHIPRGIQRVVRKAGVESVKCPVRDVSQTWPQGRFKLARFKKVQILPSILDNVRSRGQIGKSSRIRHPPPKREIEGSSPSAIAQMGGDEVVVAAFWFLNVKEGKLNSTE